MVWYPQKTSFTENSAPCKPSKIKGLQKNLKNISTHLLTLLTTRVILRLEQEKERSDCMNINKFTQKSIEAVQKCEKFAYEYGNQQIDQEHFLYSLLTIEDSLILKLITKMGISGEQFTNRCV